MSTPEHAHRPQEDLDRDLLKCVLDGDKELLQELLDAGANTLKIDREKGSPLSCAIASGEEEMVRMLLTTVSDTAQPCTAEGFPPLHLAAREGQCRIVELLCENKADVNSYSMDGAMPLHLACEENHVDVVETLIKHGAEIDREDRRNCFTPLHYATENPVLRIAEILLSHGASVNSRTQRMVTPLHIAVISGYVDVVRLLLDHGAEVNARDGDDETALCYANFLQFDSESTGTEVVELLVKHGAEMNTMDSDGRSVFHWACEVGYMDFIAVLLDNGADVNLQSEMFGTPLERALEESEHACVEVLEKHIIKLKAASLYVLDSNLQAVNTAANLAAFQKECESEVQSMKSNIHNSISFYYVIAHDTNHVAVYAKNRVLHHAMMSGEYKIMFPIYAKMIENSFIKGQRRLKLLEASLQSLNSLIGNRLPHKFLMDMLMYLNEEDHKNLIASTKEGESQ